ncbi:hypothetical protein L596_014066 [Steinernema carpocapsae]|uniref:Uncharacterized protein n=1 Tax=Steinernema carpocapsae TaxID=34508 RepID=A0A4U5NAG0_STECR|nr:hypothetical protein L596_014066 [Steinernema carpocapsae]
MQLIETRLGKTYLFDVDFNIFGRLIVRRSVIMSENVEVKQEQLDNKGRQSPSLQVVDEFSVNFNDFMEYVTGQLSVLPGEARQRAMREILVVMKSEAEDAKKEAEGR